jgi:pimeloyl-ACP methyl ester carboxylesterase
VRLRADNNLGDGTNTYLSTGSTTVYLIVDAMP